MKRLKRYELFWPIGRAAGVTWEGYAVSADDAIVQATVQLPMVLQELITSSRQCVPIVREWPQEERTA